MWSVTAVRLNDEAQKLRMSFLDDEIGATLRNQRGHRIAKFNLSA
jgi:hypothetical protein